MLDNLNNSPDQGGNWFSRARRFLVDVRSELGRVTWPARREVWATTIVVILTSTLFGVYLWSIDMGLSSLILWVMNRFGR